MLSTGSLRVYTIVWMQFCEEQVSAATINGESCWATKFEVVGSFAKWEGEGNASNGENNTERLLTLQLLSYWCRSLVMATINLNMAFSLGACFHTCHI